MVDEDNDATPAGERGVLFAEKARVGPRVGDALQHKLQKEQEHVQGEARCKNNAFAADSATEAARRF
jgi:hypothetical protein